MKKNINQIKNILLGIKIDNAMQFTIKRDALLKSLTFVQGVVEKIRSQFFQCSFTN